MDRNALVSVHDKTELDTLVVTFAEHSVQIIGPGKLLRLSGRFPRTLWVKR